MFAEKLKELRKEHNITQVKFAEIFNISSGTIAMWETGKRTPDIGTIQRIAKYFGVSVDWLTGNSDYKNLMDFSNSTVEEEPEELVILNRAAKKMTPENRQKLLDMARIMFKEDFDD